MTNEQIAETKKALSELKKFLTVKASEGAHAEVLEHVQANAAELARACGVSETVWHEGIEKVLAYIVESASALEALATFAREKSIVSDEFVLAHPVTIARTKEAAKEVVEYLSVNSAPLVKAFGSLGGEAEVARLKACASMTGLAPVAVHAEQRIKTLDGLLTQRLLETVKDRLEKVREKSEDSALETAQAAADELSASVRFDYFAGQHEMHVDLDAILKRALTSGQSDYFEFRWAMLPHELAGDHVREVVVRIPQTLLRKIKALRKKDLEAWVTEKGLHVRWNNRRGGLLLRSHAGPKTLKPTVVLVAPSRLPERQAAS